jgi:hypothetical protein
MKPKNTGLQLVITGLAVAAGLLSTPAPAAEIDRAEVGELSPLIPLPKDAIHAGLAWTAESGPKICFGMRPSEYIGHHLVEDGKLRPVFEQLVYGGFGFSTGPHGLDQSVAQGDVERDDFVCLDLTHPDALRDTGHFSILDESGSPLITQADIALTADAISEAGHSAGLDYNIFCAGNVALADGRWLFIGGHDKSGNNGIRKLTIFDPVREIWVDRSVPAVKADFLADPEGRHPELHADPLDEANTDPPHPSDLKYQRWYPSGVVLPDKKLLVLNGTDQDSSLGPPGTAFRPCASVEENAACSKVRIAVPELYDPATDSTIALENAAKLQQMYARSYVVQTGPGWRDWKVASVGEVDSNFLPGLETLGQYDPSSTPARLICSTSRRPRGIRSGRFLARITGSSWPPHGSPTTAAPARRSGSSITEAGRNPRRSLCSAAAAATCRKTRPASPCSSAIRRPSSRSIFRTISRHGSCISPCCSPSSRTMRWCCRTARW